MSDPYLLQFLADALNLRGQTSRTARRFRTIVVVLRILVALTITTGFAFVLLSRIARLCTPQVASGGVAR